MTGETSSSRRVHDRAGADLGENGDSIREPQSGLRRPP